TRRRYLRRVPWEGECDSPEGCGNRNHRRPFAEDSNDEAQFVDWREFSRADRDPGAGIESFREEGGGRGRNGSSANVRSRSPVAEAAAKSLGARANDWRL